MGFSELALTLINFNMLASSLAFLRNVVASIPTIAVLTILATLWSFPTSNEDVSLH